MVDQGADDPSFVESQSSSRSGSTAPKSSRLRRHLVRLLLITFLLGAASFLFAPLTFTAKRPPHTPVDVPLATGPNIPSMEETTISPTPQAADTAKEEDAAPRFRPQQMVGRWLRDGNIRREIVMKSDGEATMDVQLDYFTGLLYGREMHLVLAWELADDILTHSIVSGTPKANVDRLIRDLGDSISYRVVKADRDEIVLEDLGPQKKLHHWKAVRE